MANENVLNEARMIIAGFLKNRRIELKLSQQGLADRVGMARETINRMEAGKFWLGMKQYLQICEALHLFPCVAEMESETEIAEALRSFFKTYSLNSHYNTRRRSQPKSEKDMKSSTINLQAMKNVTSQKVNGVTAKIQIERGEKRGHLTTYKSLEDMVKYMTDNDVIHKFANIENDLYTIDLQKSDEANENEYENSMRINDKNFPLGTNMWK